VWVNLGGYEIEDGEELYADSLVLQSKSHEKRVRQWRKDGEVTFGANTYDPFTNEPALFRIFAKLSPTPDSILEFANHYGDVARPEVILESDGMSLSEWIAEIESMQELILQSKEYLAAVSRLRRGQRQAEEMVDLINETLSWTPVFMTAELHNGGISLRTQVYSLLDAMKLQLVISIAEHKRYRTCEQCQKPFEVTPRVNRADRIYCSDNCRVKAYQRRRKQAIELRSTGRTLRDIAKATGSDVQTIKQWLQPKEKQQ
jgi:hypothetical protein